MRSGYTIYYVGIQRVIEAEQSEFKKEKKK